MRIWLLLFMLVALFAASLYFSLPDGEIIEDKAKIEQIRRNTELNEFREKAKEMIYKLETK